MIGFKEYKDTTEGASREQEVQDTHFDAHENDAIHSGHALSESVEDHPENSRKLIIRGTGQGSGATGLAVPKHMWHGTPDKNGKKGVVGMNVRNDARAEVYGAEHRAPLSITAMKRKHTEVLADHFSKPKHEQIAEEKAAIERLKKAKHLSDSGETTDASEKTDTLEHEKNEHGEHYTGIASKGVAGHAAYTSGAGEHQKHHIVNTCPGATKGCGGGTDEHGVADTSKGTCFAPNAETQYPSAAIRRAYLDQSKHDPAMTSDWIKAHTHSIRKAADKADKNKKQLVVRPNTLNENDRSTNLAQGHLNDQRSAESKTDGKTRRKIISYQYSKTGELHDPENGVHVTHSNIGPKIADGQTISENAARDKSRIRNTIHAADAGGKDLTNRHGNKTPAQNSYLVHNLRRGSDEDKDFQKHVTHAKYYTAGREEHDLSAKEKEQGPEGHYDANGKPTTPDKAHSGHETLNGRRYDYHKQHILHPRMTSVNGHMIPSDSRFHDDHHLPKDEHRFKVNGKATGGIVATSATLSTSGERSNSSFTHRVTPDVIEKAKHNGGQWVIDHPHDQEAARGKEYSDAKPVTLSPRIKTLLDKKKAK